MDKFAGFVIRRKKTVTALFAVVTVICALLFFTVHVNFNMTDYLPPGAQSTIALEMLDQEFEYAMPNAEVTVRGVSLMEALMLKQEIAMLEHITGIMWLDDVYDIKQPLEMGETSLIHNYYKDGNARFFVVVEKGFEQQGVISVRGLLGDGASIAGEAADIEFVQTATNKEVINAIIILLPIIIIILVLSTSSWIEPLLFLASIGVSIIINMGTNAFFGSVSFLTNSVTPILQLAVSLDYAIFLLHSFGDHRKTGLNVEEAMQEAIKESFGTVAASAATTLFGFMALMFMDFRIGADLGTSLAKGIVFSFVSVMVFLPALTICVHKIIDKTRHREIMPDMANIYGILRRIAYPVVIVAAIVVIPTFLGQSRTDFMYGYHIVDPNEKSEAVWEDSQSMVLLVPRGDIAREKLLSDDLYKLPQVTSVMSYANNIGTGIPPGFLDSSIVSRFYSQNLTGITLSVDTPKEGAAAFEAVEAITNAAEKYYPGEVYSVGQSANLYDIKKVVENDNRITSLVAILAIFAVILITFKSLALPFLLLFTIQVAIWINLSVPYFTGISINYMGYLVLNTVQLGATIDYAVLLTMTYMRNRKTMPKKTAIYKAMGASFRSILVSAATLTAAGFTLALTSSNPIVADIGTLLGRGTVLSMSMVVVFLPAMLTIFDGFIGKTTYKSNFYAIKREGRSL